MAPVVQVPEQATLPVTSAPPAGELMVYETFPSPLLQVPALYMMYNFHY